MPTEVGSVPTPAILPPVQLTVTVLSDVDDVHVGVFTKCGFPANAAGASASASTATMPITGRSNRFILPLLSLCARSGARISPTRDPTLATSATDRNREPTCLRRAAAMVHWYSPRPPSGSRRGDSLP